MTSRNIELTFLPWETISPMLVDTKYSIPEIQSQLTTLYADMYDLNSKKYLELTEKSKRDQKHDLADKFTYYDADEIHKMLQYRIYELWKRFISLRENADIVSVNEIIDAFLLLCVTIMERTIRRRILYVQQLWDEQIVGY